jgi:peptide/nickel transport system permease protein
VSARTHAESALARRSQQQEQAAALGTAVVARRGNGVLRAFAANRSALAGALLLATLIALAALAPLISPYAPQKVDSHAVLVGWSWAHPLGTDNLGRDMLSRVLWGGRWSLGSATVAGLAISSLGTLVGVVAGTAGGRVDAVAMRVVDVLLALPTLVVALAVVGMVGPGLAPVLLAVIAISWVDVARIMRATTLRVRQEEYITAARCGGVPPVGIVIRHVVPNVLPTAIVVGSVNIGGLLLGLAGLSFLGFGAQPPTPEWGAMLENGRAYFLRAPHLMLSPGAALTLAAIAFNLVGDGLRDALDPRLRHGGR